MSDASTTENKSMSRRGFLKTGAAVIGGIAAGTLLEYI